MGIKRFNNSQVFIEYSNNMDDIYKNTEEYNLKKKKNAKCWIGIGNMIADMISPKRLSPIVTKIFTTGQT